MNALHAAVTGTRLLTLAACLVLLRSGAFAQSAVEHIELVEAVNEVQLSSPRDPRWISVRAPQILRPQDRLRTGPNSRAALRWTNNVVPVGANTELEILPPQSQRSGSGLFLLKGILSFFHRDQPGRIRVITRGAVAGIDGTEFVVSVDDAGKTTVSVIDGIVTLTNEFDRVTLTNGEQAVASPVAPPRRTTGFVANNVLQWVFYYPAVLDVSELGLTPQETNSFSGSLAAYRDGDLPHALAMAVEKDVVTNPARVYKAALLLSIGEVAPAEALLESIQGSDAHTSRHALALRQLIAAVKAQPFTNVAPPELSSELLAASYYEQSLASGDDALRRALEYARRAAAVAPHSGFAWVRLAELEFSFGRTADAAEALDRALSLTPRNAQAHALKGYLLAAQNRTSDAIRSFESALAIDSALGNAWLGRGLCRIRKGDRQGREDILVAAALEPRHSQVRSYLGKAFHDAGDTTQALHELELAKSFDAKDPTPPLYSALIKADQNRINEAIADLEESQSLNDNRGIYRSRLMLDQDRGVRSANLARIYSDAGMTEWSLQEASRAVSYDYANYSAHLFLANSYDALRDPRRINLRYETPSESEYLIANLLAPVGGGVLAQSVSQQEYSKLFERDRLGVVSSTEYLSRGAWTQQGAQYGTLNRSSYLFEGIYRSDPGEWHNGDFEERELRLHLKHELTPQDSLYLRLIEYDAEGGDRYPRFDPSLSYFDGGPNPSLRTREKQQPALTAGYHRQWNPNSHTLLTFARVDDTYRVRDAASPILVAAYPDGQLVRVLPLNMHQASTTCLELYSFEAQQILVTPRLNTIIGARYQAGDYDIRSHQYGPSDLAGLFSPISQELSGDFESASAYAYEQFRISDEFHLHGGLSYDYLQFPRNFRSIPFSTRNDRIDRLSPKAGVTWNPSSSFSARAAYTRSLAGAGVDQSIRIEPTQVAGVNQSFRSIIPESVSGANAAAVFETFTVSLQKRFPTRTYATLTAGVLDSDISRAVGAYALNIDVSDTVFPSRFIERLDYRESSISLSIDQLLGKYFVIGTHYRLARAEYESDLPEILPRVDDVAPFDSHIDSRSVLHDLSGRLFFNHPSGLFAQLEAIWRAQGNSGDVGDIEENAAFHVNLLAGYRFPRRKAEVAVGLLNLTDDNYRVNPLVLYSELPRSRTFVARLRFNF